MDFVFAKLSFAPTQMVLGFIAVSCSKESRKFLLHLSQPLSLILHSYLLCFLIQFSCRGTPSSARHIGGLVGSKRSKANDRFRGMTATTKGGQLFGGIIPSKENKKHVAVLGIWIIPSRLVGYHCIKMKRFIVGQSWLLQTAPSSRMHHACHWHWQNSIC